MPEPDIVTQMINSPYFLPICFICAILIIFIYFYNNRKSQFQGKRAFQNIVQENIKSLLKTFGIPTKAKLYHSIHEIGNISKYVFLVSSPQTANSVKTELMNTKVVNPNNPEAIFNFVLLRCHKKGIVNGILAFVGIGIFFVLIQKDLITIREKKMYVDGSLRFDEFGKVWTLSTEDNIGIIENIYWRDNYETSLGELAEFPRKIAYLETLLGKNVEKTDKEIEAYSKSKQEKLKRFF